MMSDQSETENGKKVYLCRRCLNHGREVPKRGHNCQFSKCECPKCKLLKERRDLSILKNQMEIEVDVVNSEENTEKNRTRPGAGSKVTKRGFQTYCSLCRNHDHHNLFEKGHKRICKFQHCDCKLCMTTRQYNDVMAQQMKVRRNQNKEKKQREFQEMFRVSSKWDFLHHWESIAQHAQSAAHMHQSQTYGFVGCSPGVPSLLPVAAHPLPLPILCTDHPANLGLFCQSQSLPMSLPAGCFFPLVTPEQFCSIPQPNNLHSNHPCLGCLQDPILLRNLNNRSNPETSDNNSDHSSSGNSSVSVSSSVSPPVEQKLAPNSNFGSKNEDINSAVTGFLNKYPASLIGCPLPVVSADALKPEHQLIAQVEKRS